MLREESKELAGEEDRGEWLVRVAYCLLPTAYCLLLTADC